MVPFRSLDAEEVEEVRRKSAMVVEEAVQELKTQAGIYFHLTVLGGELPEALRRPCST